MENKHLGDVVTFEDRQSYVTSIRASALVFEDEKSRQLRNIIARLAPSDATVLIRGETGTGKELVAREIHRLSQRNGKPFVAVNCGALTESLVESELFGHEKGAFTGAFNRRIGWFEQADGGTLFLDEIGDLPLSDQVKLLRVLQEQEIVRVGANNPISINVRIIAATNVALEKAVESGRFRKDLFYRLNVAPVELLPLRERRGDILPLVEHFIERYKLQLGIKHCHLSEDSRSTLIKYSWPGNIRELENVVHRALLVMHGSTIEEDDLNLSDFTVFESIRTEPKSLTTDESTRDFLETFFRMEASSGRVVDLEEVERRLVSLAYERCHFNQIRTAEMLGVTRNMIRHKLKRYGFIR